MTGNQLGYSHQLFDLCDKYLKPGFDMLPAQGAVTIATCAEVTCIVLLENASKIKILSSI